MAQISLDATNNGPSDNGTRLLETMPLRSSSENIQVPVAVVGMSCRLPGDSKSPTALWDFLQRGGIARNEPPPSRFNLAGHYDKSRRPRTMKSPGGMFMEYVDPEIFDGQFFNISRTDCIAMDPHQRQLLEVTYECLENAGVPLGAVSGTKTGVLVGVNFMEYAAIQTRDPEDRADSIGIGLASSILSNRISHFLNIDGPSMTLDTACSASLVAVDLACRYLDSFQADGMLVGGANMWLNPEHNEEIGMMNMTQSASGRCHSFDAKADGYVKAEGINVVYLKRLDDAIQAGDTIHAVIRGSATGASRRTAGIANPSSDAQASVVRAAYRNAGISDFRNTSFVECHGTGTLAGDPIEVKGVASVFAEGREDGNELIIGSIKSNVGHAEAAAGLSGLIKAVLAVEHGVIPGTPTFTKPNPNIDWKGSRVKASRTSLKWPSVAAMRRASVNSFGFGGANAHVVLEQAPVSRHVSSYKRRTDFIDYDGGENGRANGDNTTSITPTLLVFSSNDQIALKNYTKELSDHLIKPEVSIDLRDLAYTLSERRTKHYHRAFAIARSSKTEINDNTLVFGKQASSPPRVGFVFTGQGAQWPQMGRDIIDAFPLSKKIIEDLDKVLQTLPQPPSWSLLAELTELRSAEALRQPEFSQPLVTALQLALLGVFHSWGIFPKAVVGHSSGEIAAAAAAGLITPQDAIKIAYYRGKAAKLAGPSEVPVGMLAVGVDVETVQRYLDPSDSKVQIACYNSPSSLTISGTILALQNLCDRLQKDGHFARMLRVDLAYHSEYMEKIGNLYERMLQSENMNGTKKLTQLEKGAPGVCMFSSVTGQPMLETPDTAYWKTNMVSPVRFAQATSELLYNTQDGADFLIELGPSSTLSGPITQIAKNLPNGNVSVVQYASSLARGSDAILPMYNTAGRLFLAGGFVDLAKVNRLDDPSHNVAPRVIVDLPNYAWNHTNRYWYENQASKDWRFKKFINHDLLGSKMNGTAWRSPIFKNILKLSDLPWLRDHRLGNQAVFPATAYIAMAAEATYQSAMMMQWEEKPPARYRYQFRDLKFQRALLLEENSQTVITLALSPVSGGSTRHWYEFRICSIQDTLDTLHSTGLVCIETEYRDETAARDAIKDLELATPARVWYKALAHIGYNFGPSFQKQLMVESTMGTRESRAIVNLEPPLSLYDQSPYPMHPVVMDACFQTASPPLWRCDPAAINQMLAPKMIDSLIITGKQQLPTEGIAISSATFLGVGNREAIRNHAANVSLYNPSSGSLLFEMRGLSLGEIDVSEDTGPGHTFTRLAWNADIDMLMAAEEGQLKHWLARSSKTHTIQDIIDLVAHRDQGLGVVELNLNPDDASSLWLQGGQASIRGAFSKYNLVVHEPRTVDDAKQQLSIHGENMHVSLAGDLWPAKEVAGAQFDLAIVKRTPGLAKASDEKEIEAILKRVGIPIREGGFIIAVGLDATMLGHLGKVISLPLQGEGVCLCQRQIKDGINDEEPHRPTITHVSLCGVDTRQSPAMTAILDTMAEKGWRVDRYFDPLTQTMSDKATVLILDELFTPVMDRFDRKQWGILKHIIQRRCRILWVTSGGHFNASDPTKALAAGLFRTIRSEENLQLMTLDVQGPTEKASIFAMTSCLERLCELGLDSSPGAEPKPVNYEFVEREGVIYTSRLVPDAELTKLQSDDIDSRRVDKADLHACNSLVQLRCERLGNLDAIHFNEVTTEPVSLSDGWLEVEIHAAGLNYKDVVVSMGIVPGDETALGGEAAGVISRVTPGVARSGLEVGQRVVVFAKGCFANRVQTTPAYVHRIPDSMTFEEAAAISVVYLTSIHSLFDVAGLTSGKRVLIHSAAGGVGIAAIQLAQYVGAEIFATVGTGQKRDFLKSTFGLDNDHIFYSRNTDFARQIMAATCGRGVDVVLNSLTGDMLYESFQILADGGTFVEIGKKNILDRNSLPMAPFDRNVSFRAVDMSLERVSGAVISRLMSQLFELINGGHIKPTSPLHRFAWTDIPSAVRFLRSGKHIGKVVVSNGGSDADIQVPIRRAPKPLRLRGNCCYLIVGGLRGLCGSLAIYLAKMGAKNLAVISRSGHADERSRWVIKQIKSLGAHIDLLKADIIDAENVESAFSQTTMPVAGIIMGAMVLRDCPFDSMTVDEYHEAVQCKVQGTWNLHNVTEKLGLQLDFFTLLSSISGIVGNRGQANYSAANVFLDSFANFRRRRGQPACSVNLGIIEDAGYISERQGFQERHLDTRCYEGINDSLLRKILHISIVQQQEQQLKSPRTLLDLTSSQMITGLVIPQPADSWLRNNAQFAALFTREGKSAAKAGHNDSNSEVQALLVLLQTASADPAARLAATVDVVNKCLMHMLRLSEPMDPARPFTVHGIDSLSAVEVRNWVRTELGASVTTLDIMNASSLTAFCEGIIAKVTASGGKEK